MDKIILNDQDKIREAAETLDAIKNNQIDAFVVNTESGEKVLTLHEAENRDELSNKLIDMASEAILACDNNGRILRYNKAAVSLADKPFDFSEIDLIFNLSTLNGDHISIKDLPVNRTPYAYELIFKRNEHEILYLNLSKELLKDVNGNIFGFVVTLNDITKHMHAEIQALEMLKEKTILLQEIHHRVKNSLQIMSSIINLQSNNVTDPLVQTIFTDLRARLKSITLIHEKLYQAESISEIKMDWYIIDLINYLKESYYLCNEKVEFIFDIDPIFIVPERVITIGIIINELITNSIKYAFPDKKGHIWITLKQKGGQTILIVKDDGIGLPDSINIHESNTLGLQLISSLTGHLGGNVEFKKDNGTEVIIIFKITFEP